MTLFKKTNSISYKIICAVLVLLCLFIPIFTFTGCVENGTFYVGIISRANSGSVSGSGQVPAENFANDMIALSGNICDALQNHFGDVGSETTANLMNIIPTLGIKYELSDRQLTQLYNELFSMTNFYYDSYGLDSLLVISNCAYTGNEIFSNIVSYSENNFTNVRELRKISNTIDSDHTITENSILEKNNIYSYSNRDDIAYVFIGSNIGDNNFSNFRNAQEFIKRIYSYEYNTMNTLITLPRNPVIAQSNNFVISHWVCYLSRSNINYRNMHSETLAVEICRYLLVGADINALEDYNVLGLSDNNNSLKYYYDQANKYFGQQNTADENDGVDGDGNGERTTFIQACAQYLISPVITYNDIFTIVDDMFADRFIGLAFFDFLNQTGMSRENYLGSVRSIFYEFCSENDMGVIWNEGTMLKISKSFPYKEKDSYFEEKDTSLMQNFDPIQAIAFESWNQTDTLDGISIFFEYNKEDEDNWEILKNYSFTIRYSVKDEYGGGAVALNVIINDYIDERDLKEGIIMLDLAEIFNEYFSQTFGRFSGFLLRDRTIDDEFNEPFENFATGENVRLVNFRDPGGMGYGSYYDGIISNQSRETFVEIIFGAPALNQILNIKIVDILL